MYARSVAVPNQWNNKVLRNRRALGMASGFRKRNLSTPTRELLFDVPRPSTGTLECLTQPPFLQLRAAPDVPTVNESLSAPG